MGVLPRTLVPMLGSARAREERQIHVEFEGTRILRSSRATPHRQTVIITTLTSVKLYGVCGGGKKGGENQIEEEAHMADKETD